jgi:hypothetical protein
MLRYAENHGKFLVAFEASVVISRHPLSLLSGSDPYQPEEMKLEII